MPKHCVKLKSCKNVKPLAKLAFKLSLWHLRNSKLISARLQLNRFAWFADTVPAKRNSHRKAQNSRWVESEVIYLAHKEGVKTTEFSIYKYSIHSVLGSCRLQWCGIHLCAFSKNSPNISLCDFHYICKWKNSFTHAFLVTNDFSAAGLVHADFCQT